MNLDDMLRALNDQAVGSAIEIDATLVVTGSEMRPGVPLMTYPNRFSLTRAKEAAYQIKALEEGANFQMDFVVTDHWENTGEYVRIGVLNMQNVSPDGCRQLVERYKPTELRFAERQSDASG